MTKRTNTDQGIIAGLRAGNMGSYRILYESYWSKVRSFVLRLTGSEWVADDCAQNVFLKIWTHRASLFIEKGSLNGYIFMIARHEVIDYFRSKKNILAYQRKFAAEIRAEADLDGSIDSSQLQAVIERIINTMPAIRRQIFIMSRYKNLPNAEISSIMHISKRTVEKHISNSLSQIRLELKTYLI